MSSLYKTTIPKGWEEVKLGDISTIKNGKSNSQDAVDNGEYVFFDRSTLIKKSNKFLFDSESVILPGEGKEFISRYYKGKFDLHQRAYSIAPDKNVHCRFLYYYLLKNKKLFLIKSVGSTVKSLRLPMIKSTPVILPTPSEQDKIAEILSRIDEDIEKTDQVIEKTEKLKKGLMQKLLTKGIGHKKFKKTKLGEIPEEWYVIKIKDSGIELIDGDRGVNYPKLQDFSSNEYCLFLSNKNIKNDKFIFDECSFITKEKNDSLRKGKLKRNDIVLTTRGTIGNVAYYDSSVKYKNIRINSGMLIFRHGKKYNPLFLYKLLASPLLKRGYLSVGSGSAQPQLPIRNLINIHLPLLPIEEQKQIAKILSKVDDKIEINKSIKNKLTLLKKGLMQDLLSGRVRVDY